MSRVRKVADVQFRFAVLRANGPVLVDIYADWCVDCARVAPVLEGITAEQAGRFTVVKFDVERNPATTQRYGVRGIPTLVVFIDGHEQWRVVNVVRKQAIVARLTETAVVGAVAAGRDTPHSG